MDKNLNQLLKWSIEAQTAAGQDGSGSGPAAATGVTSTTANGDSTAAAAAPSSNGQAPQQSQLNPEILAALLGGPSDADLMKESMAAIGSDELPLDQRIVAFDNFEQLIESLDNANNLPALGLWSPLLAQLDGSHPDLRRYAAWCVGTAVQNNERSQERLLALGGLPALVRLATDAAENEAVRRKAVYALSSACRNYQPAMDVVAAELEKKGVRAEGLGKVDATNMDAVDEVMDDLKEKAKKDAATASA